MRILERHELEHMAEGYECAQSWLDDHEVPTEDTTGPLSLVGRIVQYAARRNQCSKCKRLDPPNSVRANGVLRCTDCAWADAVNGPDPDPARTFGAALDKCREVFADMDDCTTCGGSGGRLGECTHCHGSGCEPGPAAKERA